MMKTLITHVYELDKTNHKLSKGQYELCPGNKHVIVNRSIKLNIF